jgi:hypothetical protein
MRAALCLTAAALVLAAIAGFSNVSNVHAAQTTISGDPSHPSATGKKHRSSTAKHKGANDPKFCPPGQRKKPGKGSAFNC